MTWLNGAEGAAPYDAVLGLRPELQELYRSFYGKFWDDELLPPRLLELCRLRVAQVHECDSEFNVRHDAAGVGADDIEVLHEWASSDRFSDAERAALRFAEKMPWQHHEISDDEFAAVREHLGEQGAVALTVAVSLFDANCRVRTALGVDAPEQHVSHPASSAGPIH